MPPPVPSAAPPQPAPASQAQSIPADLAATRRISVPAGAFADPVAGWLICLEGPDRGRDFRLHGEKNFVGRSPTMDVCIPGDDSISREKHAIVVFDPKKLLFWVMPGESAGLVYLNGEVVHSPSQLKRDDILELGKTKLVFIPFCGEKYHWVPPDPFA
jgi:hypothetical protein